MVKKNRSLERGHPGRKPTDFNVNLEVEFVEISDDETAAFQAGIRILLGWIKEARDLELKNECNVPKE